MKGDCKKIIFFGLLLSFMVGSVPNGFSLTMQEIFRQNKSAIVKITTAYDSGKESTGSGFFINEFGVALTCYHVVSQAIKISISYNNKEFEADLLDFWKEQDTALIICKTDEKTPFVNVNPGYDHMNEYLPKELDSILATGYPLGLGLSVNEGKVSACYNLKEQPELEILQTDAAINPGNSGGPIFDSRGVVIGIAQSKVNMEAVSGMNFIYSIDWLVKQRPFIFQANAQYMIGKYNGILLYRPLTAKALVIRDLDSPRSGEEIYAPVFTETSFHLIGDNILFPPPQEPFSGIVRARLTANHENLTVADLVIKDIADLYYIPLNHPYNSELQKMKYIRPVFTNSMFSTRNYSRGTKYIDISRIFMDDRYKNYSVPQLALSGLSTTRLAQRYRIGEYYFEEKTLDADAAAKIFTWDKYKDYFAEKTTSASLKPYIKRAKYILLNQLILDKGN